MRGIRRIAAEGIHDAGRGVQFHQEIFQNRIQLLRIVIVNRLKTDIHPAAHAEPHDGWRSEDVDSCAGNRRQPGLKSLLKRLGLKFGGFSLVPAVESKQEEGDVFAGAADHAESGNLYDKGNAGLIAKRLESLFHQRFSPCSCCAFRQLNGTEHHTLIFIRQKGGRTQ